ncbi:MAG: conjugative transposon protein TraM, partial [Bacteroidota bacterium]
MPLLVLPFMTLMFWALGGGKVDRAIAQDPLKGYNMQLPGANLENDKPLDKLSYYEKATSDSLKLEQQIKNDPYYHALPDTKTVANQFMDTSIIGRKYGRATENAYVKTGKGYTDPNEAKVYGKLAELNDAMNKSAPSQTNNADNSNIADKVSNPTVNSNDVDRLEQMMNTMNQKNGADPEMQQLNGMLDKIQDIQHPDRVEERLKQNSVLRKGQVFPVVA